MKNPDQHGIILFDGVCNFCNSQVNFIIRHDKKDYFRFAPLQSEFGERVLKEQGKSGLSHDTFILIENGKYYERTTAALRISAKLDGLWPALFPLIIIPPFLRDIVYRVISKNRYKWWGQKESCMIPTPEIRSKFL